MCRSRSVTPNLLCLIGAPTNFTVGVAVGHDTTAFSIRYSPFAASVGAAISRDRKVMAHALYSNGMARDFAPLVCRPTIGSGNFDPQSRPMGPSPCWSATDFCLAYRCRPTLSSPSCDGAPLASEPTRPPPDASAKLSAPNDNAIGLAIATNHCRRVMCPLTLPILSDRFLSRLKAYRSPLPCQGRVGFSEGWMEHRIAQPCWRGFQSRRTKPVP